MILALAFWNALKLLVYYATEPMKMTKYVKLIANFKPCTLQLNTWKTLKTLWFSLLSLIFNDCNINLSNSSYVNNLYAPGMKIQQRRTNIRWNDRHHHPHPPHLHHTHTIGRCFAEDDRQIIRLLIEKKKN